MNQLKLPSGRIIGTGQSPYVICEIGSNWVTKSDCLISIEKAKSCGADAVKYQLYSDLELYGIPNPDLTGMLPSNWIPELKAHADKIGIEFLCTGFSPQGYEYLDGFVSIHKIASAEMCHVGILEKLRNLGKPVIISTGGHTNYEIERSLRYLEKNDKIIMYCVSEYPARLIDFNRLNQLKNFGCVVGFSDHTIDCHIIPRESVCCGASVIEKHVNFIESVTPDSPHSLKEDEFKYMIRAVKNVGKWPGEFPQEQGMIKRYNRRIIATKDIKAGDTLTDGENMGIFRSLTDENHAYSPFKIDLIKGRTALVDITMGSGIGDGDF